MVRTFVVNNEFVKGDPMNTVTEIGQVELQDTSLDIWSKKYCLKDSDMNPIDNSISDTFVRVATALSEVESDDKLKGKWKKEFLWALNNGAVPAGRIISNAGSAEHKSGTSLINCTVSRAINDSMDEILESNRLAGLTLKAGCGIGYEFSTLRPAGSYVSGSGATTSGPLPFMNIFNETCKTVSSAGGRRGAQMATFDIQHPDVEEFIRAKREDGALRQFNLSLLITDSFIQAVTNDQDWNLSFPVTKKEIELRGYNVNDESKFLFRDFPVDNDYFYNDLGEVACLIYKTVKAKGLWDLIMSSTYNFAEPGFILVDRINEYNNNWFCESIRATNPCGEQPLNYDGSCLLGSVNLTKFVVNPFTSSARFDMKKFKKVVRIFTRMLDNVVEISNLPLEAQRREMLAKRRHGMGFMGLGSSLCMLNMKYGDRQSVEFAEQVSECIAVTGFEVGVELSKEKGEAPALEEEYEITPKLMRQRPELSSDGYEIGDKVKGRILHAGYSRYMQNMGKSHPDLIDSIKKYGLRFTHHSSIAPTGTIALSLGNNCSNGIEPSFAHHYSRNILVEGKKSKEKVDVFSYELLAYRAMVNPEAMPCDLPETFSDTDSVSTKGHVDIQAAAQKWVDSSISKTINVPTDIDYDDFKGVYLYAHSQNLKGCTTFRFNPEAFQGVLVKEEDLEKTTYVFELEGGEKISAKGNQMIDYDGELHTAANLYDALKEGTYGK